MNIIGNADRQATGRWMYATGQGVSQDDKAAVKWYRRAAKQGNAIAQYTLGVVYANGQGVPQDNIYAHMWTTLAAVNGG